MSHTFTNLPEMTLIGISTRTKNEWEMAPVTSRIGPLVGRFMGENIPAQIPGALEDNTIYSVYHDYESNEFGEYTYFIGRVVDPSTPCPEGFQKIQVPSQKYAKFTSENGPMPQVCINLWKKIWTLTSNDLEDERSFIGDIEIYDERAMDPHNTIMDVLIGLKG